MADTVKIPDDIKAMSFEDALAELDEIVAKLESGSVNLEDSIDIYTRGSLLKLHCEQKLKSAQSKIEKLTINAAGDITGATPLDTE